MYIATGDVVSSAEIARLVAVYRAHVNWYLRAIDICYSGTLSHMLVVGGYNPLCKVLHRVSGHH